MVATSPAAKFVVSVVMVREYCSSPLLPPPLPQAAIQQSKAKQINKFNDNKNRLFVDFAILLSFSMKRVVFFEDVNF